MGERVDVDANTDVRMHYFELTCSSSKTIAIPR